MACYMTAREGETLEDRNKKVETALDRLERFLADGSVKVVIDRASGALAFSGWSKADRDDLSDVCTYRLLTTIRKSGALKRAIAKAEALAGRKFDERAVLAGMHSHDGGRTFAKH